MVSTTGARVVAGSVLVIGIALTLHFLFRKKKGKRDAAKKDESLPKASVNKDENDEKVSQTTSSETSKGKNDLVKDHVIHGKRKHPNDDFINTDIESPKKQHEVRQEKGDGDFDVNEKPDSFDFFRKELQEFLKDGEKENDKNSNQNANQNNSSESHIGNGTGENKPKQEAMSSQTQAEGQINQAEIPREVITAEVTKNLSATQNQPQTAEVNKHEKSTESGNGQSNGGHQLSNGNLETNGQAKSSTEMSEDLSYKNYSEEDITDALLVSQTSPGILSGSNTAVLVSLLSHPDSKLQDAALNGINRCSTFTRNQNLFREHGCLSRLSHLLHKQRMSKTANPKVVTAVANAITNLSSNEDNHKKLEDCVSTLVDFTLEDETGESVCLSSLKALTNLSLTNQHHGHYTRVVQRLYDLIDTGSPSIKLQAAKVLVNLSCNPDLVPHMLAAKAPTCSVDLLKQGTDEELLLRWTTLLANILTTAKDQNLTSASLPADDKAPSPETMYTALYGVSNTGQLKSKVYLLSRHRNENISHQASKVYQVITKM